MVIYDTLPSLEEQEFHYKIADSKIHQYKMVRLNELVDRWINII